MGTFHRFKLVEPPVGLEWLFDELEARRQAHLYRERRVVRHGPNHVIEIDGCRLVNFGTNDYLGLASHPAVVAAATSHSSSDDWPVAAIGAGASPLVSGYTEDHWALERELAAFEHAEAALVFSTGYAANVGTISGLVSKDDLILSDALNHASLIDGCRLSGARIVVYPHADVEFLEARLRERSKGDGRTWIVTDSVFSMDGDVAPLGPIVALAKQFAANLIVDEAHGTGVIGKNGVGACEEANVLRDTPVRIGTMSKALGGLGGFVVGSQILIDYLRHAARPYLFSTALPANIVRGLREALRLAHGMEQQREELRARSIWLRKELKALGLSVGQGVSPIIPIIMGTAQAALEASEKLQAAGFFVPAIRPPTVPRHQSRLRISLSVAHRPADLERLVTAFADASP